MKILELNSDSISIIDQCETRWLMGGTLIVFGTVLVGIFFWTLSQPTHWEQILPTLLVSLLFFLPGICVLATTKVVHCQIDKRTGLIEIKHVSLTGSRTMHFYIAQVMSMEVKEIAGDSYFIYKVNFVMSNYKRICLTYHPSSDQVEMELLSNRVARFLNIASQLTKTRDSLSFITPF